MEAENSGESDDGQLKTRKVKGGRVKEDQPKFANIDDTMAKLRQEALKRASEGAQRRPPGG